MSRLAVNKTYKIYVGGKFPRTESGRYYPIYNKQAKLVANMCLSSRKDFRNAVVAARAAQSSWAASTALNKGQVLYRIAEMLEGRKGQFVEELMLQGATRSAAQAEVEASVDRLLYYAGWSDKFQQIFSAVNPVSGSYFNFSVLEAVGVVAILAPEKPALLGLVSFLAPAMVGGNTVVILASESLPLTAVSFAEVLNSSDVPGGVVNILTGKQEELYGQMASHMDVNALIYGGTDETVKMKIREAGSENMKRLWIQAPKNMVSDTWESPYLIEKTMEVKTTWHPTAV